MVRTVRVRLELDRTDFKQGLRESAGDLRAFDAEVKTLGKSADRTGVELKTVGDGASKLGDDVKRSSRDVDGLGDSSSKTTTKVKSLDTQIREARASTRQLGEEFLRTRDVDVFEKMRASGGDLAGLQRTKKDLNDLVGEFDKVGRKGGQAMQEGLSGAIDDFKAESGVILPAAIAVAISEGAPLIGAAVSAAALLGLGAVGLGAGIALAFKDPAVSSAASALGKDVGDRLKAAASDSFKQPLANAFQIFNQGFDQLEPRIQRIFAGLAPSIERLAQGLVGLIDRAGPGLEHAFAAAGPLLDALAAEMPRLGSAISAMFDSFARSGPGATQFLHLFMEWLDGALRGIGLVTEGLSKMFQGLTSGPGLALTLGPLGVALDQLGVFGDGATKSFQRLGQSAAELKAAQDNAAQSAYAHAAALNAVGEASDKILGKWMGVDQAVLALNQAMLGLKTSVDSNGTSLDQSTAKGQANAQALLGAASAAENLREKNIAGGQSASYANSQYEDQIAALRQAAVNMGFTAGQVDALIGKYRQVPNGVPTSFLTPGLLQAIGGASTLSGLLNSLDGRVVTSTVRNSIITTYYANNASSNFVPRPGLFVAQEKGGIVAAAQGMIATSPTVLFGERQTGREVYIPEKGISDQRGLMLANAAANMHGGRVVAGPMGGPGGTQTVVHEHRVTLAYPDGRKVGELVIQDGMRGGPIRHYIRQVAQQP